MSNAADKQADSKIVRIPWVLIIIIIIHGTGAVLMTQSHFESSHGSSDELCSGGNRISGLHVIIYNGLFAECEVLSNF